MNLTATKPPSWWVELALISASFSLIFALGTAGNSLVLAVLFLSGQRNTKTTNLFIVNLAVADLFFIVFCVPFRATVYTLDQWPFGPAACKLLHFIIFLTVHASIFTLTACLPLWRYLAICYPLRSGTMRTPRNALIPICLVWTLALVFSGPYLSYYSQLDLASSVVCIPTWGSKPRFIMDMCTLTFGYLLPVLVLGLTYTRTVRHLWTSVDPINDTSQFRRAKRRVTNMIIIVTAVFCLCWLPHHLVVVCMWSGHFPLNSATYVLRILSHLTAYASSCLNPFIYALVSKHFRKGFREVLSCPLSGRGRMKGRRRRDGNKVHVAKVVNTVSSGETSSRG